MHRLDIPITSVGWLRWKTGSSSTRASTSARATRPAKSPSAPLNRREPGADRGLIPAGIAPKGWQEQRVGEFDPDNLYVKIDGREGYYKSFGFKKLNCLTLASGETTIDLELYEASVDEDTVAFIARRKDAQEAAALAAQFTKGFAGYGTETGNQKGVRWFKDRYLKRVSGAGASGNFVVGVYRAADEKAGAALYQRLIEAAEANRDRL